MSTTLFTAFLTEVLPFVHDCPQFVAVNALRNASIEFCERSHYWQVDASPVDVLAGTATYTIPVPAGTAMVEINQAWLKGQLLIPQSAEVLTRIYRGVDWRTQTGPPAYITALNSNDVQLVLVPQISVAQGLTVRAVVAPTRASTGIDTFIYERQLEVIAYGARARLYGMSGQPYYDPQSSELYRHRFMAGVNDARIKANRSISRAPISVEFQPFA